MKHRFLASAGLISNLKPLSHTLELKDRFCYVICYGQNNAGWDTAVWLQERGEFCRGESEFNVKLDDVAGVFDIVHQPIPASHRPTTAQGVIDLLYEITGLAGRQTITEETKLTDLSMDSLDAVEFCMYLEEKFELDEITHEEAESFKDKTVGDVAAAVKEKLKK